MLVLTRKLQEQIRIGENITLTILRVKGSTVRLGIEAPRSVRVVRGELELEHPTLDRGDTANATTERATVDTVLETADSAEPDADSGEPHGAPNRLMQLVMEVTGCGHAASSAV